MSTNAGPSFDMLKNALETMAVAGAGAAAGGLAATFISNALGDPIPLWIVQSVGVGVGAGASRSLRAGLMTGTFAFNVEGNTALGAGGLMAFMSYTGLDLPIFGATPIAHAFLSGALAGWFV